MTLLIGKGSLDRQRKFRPKLNKLHLLQNKFPCPFRAKQSTWLLYTVFSNLFFCTFNPNSKGRSIRTMPNLNEALLCELRTWGLWTERTEQHHTFFPLKQAVFKLQSVDAEKFLQFYNALPFINTFSNKIWAVNSSYPSLNSTSQNLIKV